MDLVKDLKKISKESTTVLIIIGGLLLYFINTHKGPLFGTENKVLLSVVLFGVILILWWYINRD